MALDVQPNLNVSPLTVVPTGPQADPAGIGSATTAMIEAFRRGQITADEMADRAMRRPAVQAAVNMATDPAVLAAQKQAILATGAQADITTKVDQAKLELLQQEAKIPVESLAKYKELQAANLLPVTVSIRHWDDDARKAVDLAHVSLRKWKSEMARAEDLEKSVSLQVVNDPITGIPVKAPVTTAGKLADPDAVSAVSTFASLFKNSAEAWMKAGQPSVWTDLHSAPKGQSLPMPAAGAGVLPQDEPMAPVEVPDGQQQPAPIAVAPRIAAAGTPVSKYLTTGTPPLSAEEKPISEVRVRANFAAVMQDEANLTFQRLKKEGSFNPASWGNYLAHWGDTLTFGLAEGFKPADLKAFDAAKFAWSEGFLRLQSGAAVPETEVKRYLKGLFPAVMDTQEVQDQKERMRSNITEMSRAIASGKPRDVTALSAIKDNANAFASQAIAREKDTISRGQRTTFNGVSGYMVPGATGPRFIPDEKKATVNRGLVVPKE